MKVATKSKKVSSYLIKDLNEECEKGNFENVKYLIIRCKEKSHQKSNDAIKQASKNGHDVVVKFLINNGAKVSGIDDETLENYTKNNNKKMIDLLTSKGINPCYSVIQQFFD